MFTPSLGRRLSGLAALVLFAAPFVRGATPVISEFMAINERTLADEDGEYPDWIEIHNPGPGTLDLRDWALSDDPTRPLKWRFPAVSVVQNAYLVVFASQKNRINPAGKLHTNFKLSGDGEFLGLFDPQGEQVSGFSPVYPLQHPSVSYGFPQPTNPAVKHYFSQPTPGTANNTGFTEVAAEPTFSHPSGAYPANFSLTLSAPGMTIRYTTNGANPTTTSTLYSTPISINRNLRVKAKAFKDGALPSRTVQEYFVRLDSVTASFESNLGIVIVDSNGQAINQDPYTPVSCLIIDTAGGIAGITDVPEFAGAGNIKIRGSSSLGFPKHSYTFETMDENIEEKDVSVFGFPPGSDWILYGPYTDKTLMRDVLSYGWSNEIGRYAVRTRFVEAFVRTAAGGSLTMGDYQGVYAFMEKIKRDPKRVDIQELLPSDNTQPAITGGYILKKDRLDPGDSGFTTSRGQLLAFVEPKEQEITTAQRNYIKGYLDSFETALYGAGFTDPVNGYAKYIDVDSFIDHHLMVEVTKNIDGYRLSTFMYKDRGGKLNMGPIWDYNLCLGNADYLDGWIPTGWYYSLIGAGDYPWYGRLFQDPDFVQRYIDRWTQLRRAQFQTENMLSQIDLTVELLVETQGRNFTKWPILGTYVWPNKYIGQTYQDEIGFMRDWLDTRLAWWDTNYLTAPSFSQDGGIIPPGFNLRIGVPVGTVYYTLDGSDPRLPGGGIRPGVFQSGSSTQTVLVSSAETPQVRVLVPVDGALGSTWTQLAFNDAGWIQGSSGVGVGYETATGYQDLIDVDVVTEMSGVNGTVYLRIPFQVTRPADLDSLLLQVKYDDGFVAYLNGTEVARRNAPATLAWNSVATAQHDDAQAVIFEPINITSFLGRLRTGSNVLAIQGLNINTTSSDMLILPELYGTASLGGDPITLSGPTRVVARSHTGAQWSGKSDASFVLDQPLLLRITEFMYHPADPGAGSIYDADDFEYLELQNIGSGPISLLGVRFTQGIEFDFSSGAVTTLGAGEYLVVVKNRAAFSSRYLTTGMKIAGEYTGNLENDGETLILVDGRGETILSFSYDDLWYPVTDGDGYSLVMQNPAGDPSGWGNVSRWAPSALEDGSPGAAETVAPGGFQLPGDANQNGSVDLPDAVALLLNLFQGGRALPCGGSASEGGNRDLLDLNGDQQMDVSDAVYVLAYLFRQGPPPVLGTSCVRLPDCPNACSG